MKKILIICGPTASGKSALALRLAEDLGGELVNADSGQVYRGCDIGTAKPSIEERRRVPHHLIDIVDPNQHFDVSQFVTHADAAIAHIIQKKKCPIVVGGTGLYLRALVQGLFEGPPRDEDLRKKLEERIQEEGLPSLYRELQKHDPETASRLSIQDSARIIRALEVWHLTGQPISELQKGHAFSEQRYEAVEIAPALSREELYKNINTRVQEMMSLGWLEEVRQLCQTWGTDLPIFKLLGYKELREHLKDGSSSQDVISKIQQKTRNFAKRQMTWFRANTSLHWITSYEQGLKIISSFF